MSEKKLMDVEQEQLLREVAEEEEETEEADEGLYDEEGEVEETHSAPAKKAGFGGLLGVLDAFPGGKKLVLGLFAGIMGLSVVGGAFYAFLAGGSEKSNVPQAMRTLTHAPATSQFAREHTPLPAPSGSSAKVRFPSETKTSSLITHRSAQSVSATTGNGTKTSLRPSASSGIVPRGRGGEVPLSHAGVAFREKGGRRASSSSASASASAFASARQPEVSEAERLLRANPFLSEDLRRVLERAVDRIVAEKLAEERRRLREEVRGRVSSEAEGRVHIGVNVGDKEKGKKQKKTKEENHHYRVPSAVVIRGILEDAGQVTLVLDDGSFIFEGAPYGEGRVVAVDRGGFTVRFPNGKEERIKAVLALPEAAPRENTVAATAAVAGAGSVVQE
ncbi:hypothetical protein [Thermosulfurimonas sp. F29]|uniref:hypothetical protein n=1 Tax=Thermosulfurimonas sp. F29 TaxID=2867247 RepID=UPI001C8338C4|nr:hypothetical protein [Thermosulfurimonas sp. F29]MBX6424200.1 hypothetical protein [Thermosulfurimonas sp. F29]